jgi:hypothetical protein
MKIKSKLPDKSMDYTVIKYFDTKKCLLNSVIDNFVDDRPKLDYLESEFLSLVRYRVKYNTLKEKYNYTSGFDGMLNSLIQKHYLYRDGVDIFRVSREGYMFSKIPSKIYYQHELKIIKEWDFGFAYIKFYLSHPYDNDCGAFLFDIEFKNQMNFETFVKFNNYNYNKFIKTYELFLLGYIPMSDIEFKKNIKIMVLSLYLTKLYDDLNMRYGIVPEDLLFKEFYRWLNSIEPNIQSLPPFWDNDVIFSDVDVTIG